MFSNLSIKLKLMLSVTGIVAIMMVISGYISSSISFNAMYERIVQNEAPASVAKIAEKFEASIKNAINLSMMVADNPFLKNWINSGEDESGQKTAVDFFKTLKEQGVDFVFMVSAKSNKYYTHDGLFKTVSASNERDSWFFNTLKSNKKIDINIDIAEKTNIPTAYINILMGSSDAPSGVAGCGINLELLSDELKRIKLTENSFTYLIGPDGGIKAHPDTAYITTIKTIRAIDDPEYRDTVVDNLLKTDSGHIEYTDRDGVSKLVVHQIIPSSGWKVVIEIPKQELGKGLGKIKTATFIMLIVFIVALVLVLNLLLNVILKSVSTATSALHDISEGEGDLTKRLRVDSTDEIGELSTSFNRFIEKLQSIIAQVRTHSTNVSDAASDMLSIARSVSDESRSASEKTGNISVSAGSVNSNVTTVASAMEEASTNIAMLASAVEEMSSTVNEISKRASEANATSQHAVSVSNTTSEQMKALGDSAQEIGRVTETITEISEQTNLLALNATIEAARAGEAGKGFAVVAGEIKALASQTSAATQEIKSKITGIQEATGASIENIGNISSVINDFNQLITSIAAAIEEQTSTTSEISSNISQLSQGISEVNNNVAESAAAVSEISTETELVNTSVSELAGSGARLKTTAENLSELSESLNALMRVFKV